MPAASGFTLIEVLVVLVLMGLAAAIVAPAIIAPRHNGPSLAGPLATARALAARRGERVSLEVTPAGAWRIDPAGSARQAPLARGELPSAGVGVRILVSPIGTCSFDAASAGAAGEAVLEPLTCDLRAP